MGQMLGCVKVKESKVGIKEVFEKFDEVLQPGCHYVPWYCGRRLAATHSLGIKHTYLDTHAKTKDNVLVTLCTAIQYRVLEEMVVEAHYKAGNPVKHMSLYVSNAIIPLVSNMDLDSVYQHSNEIAASVHKQIEKAMSAIGFEILQTFIFAIKLDESVNKAMNDAVKLRVEAREKTEAGRVLHHKKAETAAESKYLIGLGMARQFQAIADGVNGNKLAFPENVPDASAATSSKDIMDMVMANHYFDTVKEISASGNYNAVFVANGNVAVKDIPSQVTDGLFLLQRNAAAAAAKDTASASQINNAPLEIDGKIPPTKS